MSAARRILAISAGSKPKQSGEGIVPPPGGPPIFGTKCRWRPYPGSALGHGSITIATVGDRIFTWPNVLSAARLAGVPVFLWLGIGPRTATADIIAAALLGAAGISDWLDGKLARMFNQTSRLGTLLDPLADRL